MIVLALNSGSSSLKLALYDLESAHATKLVWGEAEEIGKSNGRVWLRQSGGHKSEQTRTFQNAGDAADFLIERVRASGASAPQAIGHRIVHGGPALRQHQRITPETLVQLEAAIEFAPVHLPASLAVIHTAMNIFPGVPHVACFDTAFHSSIPDYAARFPFAEKFWNAGIRRYGFHGLSCESAVRGLGRELAPRTVLAHLGNGCSITALRNGVSMENTMGLTPTGGVMMGTRSGDLDPGVILHLLRNGYDSQKLDALLNHDSGLQGVSGVSSDMRSLLERSPVDSNAKLAIQMFCYSVRKSIGALATVLGGIEMLVFTGGIGEHAAPVRADICSGLEHLGIELDDAANQRNAQKIASARSKCDVRIVEADEDLQIALHSARLYP